MTFHLVPSDFGDLHAFGISFFDLWVHIWRMCGEVLGCCSYIL